MTDTLSAAPSPLPATTPTIVTDIRIPFVRLMLFLVKLSFAAIPAAIIVSATFFIVGGIIAAIFGGGPMMGGWRGGRF